jgi:hypothetical protein
MVRNSTSHRCGIAWLELLVVLAAIAMFLQLFPSVLWDFVAALDVRAWSSSVWFGLNVAVVLILAGIRFGAGIVEFRVRCRCRATEEREKAKQQQRLKEERELFERMREARKKQVI